MIKDLQTNYPEIKDIKFEKFMKMEIMNLRKIIEYKKFN